MINVQRYQLTNKQEWDCFCKKSKNSLFMFQRNYMDYHKEKFTDSSLMFYYNDKLIAVLPMNRERNVLFSHGGLTFGGFVADEKMKQHIMNDCFAVLRQYMKENGLNRVVYKLIPHIYHRQPCEEDKYCLKKSGGKLDKIEVSTVINLKNILKMSKGRKAQVSRARREGVVICELYKNEDFERFISLENDVLRERYHTKAVHTGKELKMLHDYFPQNIHLFGALYNQELIAGTVIYEYENVIHTQYMAANKTAREIGALDLTVNTIMDNYKDNKLWLDFGISTENSGEYLNEGLAAQKEGFGGRTNVYETWSMEI